MAKNKGASRVKSQVPVHAGHHIGFAPQYVFHLLENAPRLGGSGIGAYQLIKLEAEDEVYFVRIITRSKHHWQKDMQCVACGRRITHFVLHLNRTHEGIANLNLVPYAGNRKLTKDHIIPHVHGGTKMMSNIQVMCEVCNLRKSASVKHLNREIIERILGADRSAPQWQKISAKVRKIADVESKPPPAPQPEPVTVRDPIGDNPRALFCALWKACWKSIALRFRS